MARRPLRDLTRHLAPALLAALVTAGCAADGADPPTPAGAAAASSTVGTGTGSTGGSGAGESAVAPDPRIDAAALAATSAWFSWDTRVDARPNDTARRLALGLLAPEARRQVLAFAGDAAPGADWDRWTARRARATVVCRLGGDDRPPDGADQAWRQVVATITLRGDGGWTEVVERTAFLQLTLIDGHWLVSDVR